MIHKMKWKLEVRNPTVTNMSKASDWTTKFYSQKGLRWKHQSDQYMYTL